MRAWIAAWTLLLLANHPFTAAAAEAPGPRTLDVRVVGATHPGGGPYWLKIQPPEPLPAAGGIPVLVIHAARQTGVKVFAAGAFVVILSSADAAAALPIAQRIRERVATVRVEGFGNPIALTCSIGLAASDILGVWGDQLLNRADAAVYAAKRSGRNQVCMAAAA